MEVRRRTLFEGMSAWRWILFVIAFWPLGIIGHMLARIAAGLASAFATAASVGNVRISLTLMVLLPAHPHHRARMPDRCVLSSKHGSCRTLDAMTSVLTSQLV